MNGAEGSPARSATLTVICVLANAAAPRIRKGRNGFTSYLFASVREAGLRTADRPPGKSDHGPPGRPPDQFVIAFAQCPVAVIDKASAGSPG
jgi:hypothetical protein